MLLTKPGAGVPLLVSPLSLPPSLGFSDSALSGCLVGPPHKVVRVG